MDLPVSEMVKPPRIVCRKPPEYRSNEFLAYNTYTMGLSQVQGKLNIIREFSKDQFQIEQNVCNRISRNLPLECRLSLRRTRHLYHTESLHPSRYPMTGVALKKHALQPAVALLIAVVIYSLLSTNFLLCTMTNNELFTDLKSKILQGYYLALSYRQTH